MKSNMCIKTCNKAVTLDKNPLLKFWRPLLNHPGLFALKNSRVKLYHVSIFDTITRIHELTQVSYFKILFFDHFVYFLSVPLCVEVRGIQLPLQVSRL